MTEEIRVEHHWHQPTTKQVYQAMHQYLAELGVDRHYMQGLVEDKVGQAVQSKIETIMNDGRFDTMIISAV